jgi:transposase-like protein
MMEERGIDVDHSTINRWVLKFTPFIEKEFRKKKRPIGEWMRPMYQSKGNGSIFPVQSINRG